MKPKTHFAVPNNPRELPVCRRIPLRLNPMLLQERFQSSFCLPCVVMRYPRTDVMGEMGLCESVSQGATDPVRDFGGDAWTTH